MTDFPKRLVRGGEEGAQPVRLIPRPAGSQTGEPPVRRPPQSGLGLLDLMGSAEGRRTRIAIHVAHGHHKVADLQVLEHAVADFLRSCGFEPDPARPPAAGAWLCRHEHWLAREQDPAGLARVFRAALVDLMAQARSPEGPPPAAGGSLIGALAPFPSAVLLLGCLLVVKSPQRGCPVLVVCPVAEDLQARIDSDPDFLRDPDAVLTFLDKSLWLMPMPRWTRTAAPEQPLPSPAEA